MKVSATTTVRDFVREYPRLYGSLPLERVGDLRLVDLHSSLHPVGPFPIQAFRGGERRLVKEALEASGANGRAWAWVFRPLEDAQGTLWASRLIIA